MSFTIDTAIGRARELAQEPSTVPLLTTDDAYQGVIRQALGVFDVDVPNVRRVHHTVTVAGFRIVLAGTGALAGLTGLDAWVVGKSSLIAVWHPYDTTAQGRAPVDENTYRVVEEPGPLTVLEFLELSPSSGVLRLEFERPHVVHAVAPASTSIPAAHAEAFYTLAGSIILDQAAVRAAQNTGTSAIPSDTVERRTQGGEYRARAKDLRERYKAMVGVTTGADLRAAHAFADIDVGMSHPWGALWHPRSGR